MSQYGNTLPTDAPTKCRWCAHFGGWAPYLIEGRQIDGEAVWCVLDPKFPTVNALPEVGCVCFRREPGTDDDLMDE